jgi:hypothetical protein
MGMEVCACRGTDRLPIQEHLSGALGRVVRYQRSNGRCPAFDFLDGEIQKPMWKKFAGQFDALTKSPNYCNHQRFRPLSAKGKPLWEFKEHDHRLYCFRKVVANMIVVVLFNGWVKDKQGKTEKEAREIEKALGLYVEFMSEFPGGVI